MKLINTKLTKAAKNIFKENKEKIEDIVLFGSIMKGKDNPDDMDVLIIFKDKVDKAIEIKFKKYSDIKELDLNSITLSELKSEGFVAREGVYLEGYSLINDGPVNDKLGFCSIAFIKYDLNNIKGSNRIRFYYALHGRNKQSGFLDEIKAKRFSESVIVCDYLVIEKAKQFFEQWNISSEIIPSMIPKRLRQILLGQ